MDLGAHFDEQLAHLNSETLISIVTLIEVAFDLRDRDPAMCDLIMRACTTLVKSSTAHNELANQTS